MHQLADQLDAHAATLRRTLEQRKRALPRLNNWVAQTAGLTIAGVGLFTPGVQAFAVAAALYSFILAIDSTVRTGAQAMESGSIEASKRINAGWVVNPREAAELQASVDALSEGLSLVSREVPVLLVIDDAESLDGQTAQFVQTILAGRGDISVVIAADVGTAVGSWGEWLRTTATNPPDQCRGVRLNPLPNLDLAMLATVLLPAMPEVSTSELARLLQVANGQPGVLVDHLSLAVVRDALRSGTPLPFELTDFTEDGRDDRRHEELSPQDRDTLELLACLGRSTHAGWVASVGLSAGQLLRAPATGRVQLSEDGLVSFTSQRAYQTSLRACRRHHREAQVQAMVEAYRGAIREAHSSDAWNTAPEQAREGALAVLTAYDGTNADPVWLSELLDLRRRNGGVQDLQDVLLQAVLTRLTTPGVGAARLVRAAADTLAALGHRDRAIALFQGELDRVTVTRGPTDSARIPALEALAFLNAATGHDLLGRPESSSYLLVACR